MAVSGITSGGSIPQLNPAMTARPSTPGATSFADRVIDSLRDVNAQQLESQQQIQGLATGETDNIHDVVLSVAKADLAFRLVLEIRNRLITSYQELMRMQV